jgi:hypothetical protein
MKLAKRSKKRLGMFHWRPARRLPRDIELEVEMLLSDIRGEARVPLPPAEEGVGEASWARGPSLRDLRRFLPRADFIRQRRRSVEDSGADDRR